jgi:transcriptional regulator with PAS, ATPase and Fis domain
MQVKLLRVIQEREVRRIGETRARAVNVRLIAATNRTLSEEVEAGRFRADLYYRLRVIDLEIPPLRDRLDDLADLVSDILRRMAVRLQRPVVRYAQGVLERLLEYPWPGNIRASSLVTTGGRGPYCTDSLPRSRSSSPARIQR